MTSGFSQEWIFTVYGQDRDMN